MGDFRHGCAGRPLRTKRRCGDRVPGDRRTSGRPGLRPRRHRRSALDLGSASARSACPRPSGLLAGSHARQARNGTLRPDHRTSDARDADGRSSSRHGRRGIGPRRSLERSRGQSAGGSLRRDVPGPDRRSGAVRSRAAGAPSGRLSMGADRGRVAGAPPGSQGGVGNAGLPRAPVRGAGADSCARRGVQGLVRDAHATQPRAQGRRSLFIG